MSSTVFRTNFLLSTAEEFLNGKYIIFQEISKTTVYGLAFGLITSHFQLLNDLNILKQGLLP